MHFAWYCFRFLPSNCNFIYLGVKFHTSGSFTEAKQNIYNRDLKAYFKFCKAFNDVKSNITTFLHVFDHTVKPVILYGSKIWGTIQKYNKMADNTAKDFFHKLCSKSVFESTLESL